MEEDEVEPEIDSEVASGCDGDLLVVSEEEEELFL